ncbi:MAG: U32 family peptidase, partial [Clostridiales bacterium]|nr:U32 family peptidase [Clostridiales bacterium]
YGGLKSHGLRAFAGNFSYEELQRAVALCHKNQKKFYLTLNSYPFDSDLEDFLSTAKQGYQAGVDAAIVSDLGAFSMLREKLPALPLHVSTQANTLNTPAAICWHQMGAQRVIVAREMNLAQIGDLCKSVPPTLEIEAFVHGAMCMAYSGRCMLSNAMIHRGGNQGACAQPCRWQYAVMEMQRPGEYLPVYEDDLGTSIFSAYDLNAMALLPRLVESGLGSLKIEGRMKTEYYVSTVVGAYRRGLDALSLGETEFEKILPELTEELEKASHRPSNTGFYEEKPTAGAVGMIQTREYVGRILENTSAGVKTPVLLKNRFYVKDSLEVLTPQGSFSYQPEQIWLEKTGETINTHSIAGDILLLEFPFPVAKGDILRGPTRNHSKVPQ